MYTCILCLREFDDPLKSKEHIFPDSIGGNIVIEELCKDCNSHLGQWVDAPLVNHVLIQMKRALLRIPGKSGGVPNPFENGVLASDPSQKVKYRFENGEPSSLDVVQKVDKYTTEDGKKRIRIILDKKDEKDIPGIIKAMEDRAKKKGEDFEISDFKQVEERIEQPAINIDLTISINGWQRDIIKIAYELTYMKLGKDYLSDPIAKKIQGLLQKTEVLEDDLKEANLFAEIELFDNEEADLPFLNNFDSLYGVLVVKDKKLYCYVQIFDCFKGHLLMKEDTDIFPDENGVVIHIDVTNNKSTEMPITDFEKSLRQ